MKNLVWVFGLVLVVAEVANAQQTGLGRTPSVVDKSPASKSCPSGYQMLGKQCARTVTAPPMRQCRIGFSLVGATSDQCVQYSGKIPSCMDGYNRVGGTCLRTTTSTADENCPPDYFLNANGDCVRPQKGADKLVCPPGSVQRGETCTIQSTQGPQLVCPDGFILEGKRCRIEETYDCTPERKRPTKRMLGTELEKLIRFGVPPPAAFSTSKMPPPPPPPAPVVPLPLVIPPPPEGKDQSIYIDDYVLKATCKRVRSEPARKVCTNGVLDGKVCLVEVEVRTVVQPGPIFEEVARPVKTCPNGFSSEPGSDICILTEELPVQWNCPEGTQDLGERCAYFIPCNFVCEPGFALEGEVCVQTQFAPPLVEYTVKFACVGKECENH